MTRFGSRLIIATCAALAGAAGPFAQRIDVAGETVNLDASCITIEVTDAPVAEVAERFAEQSGNLPFDLDKLPAGQTVTLSVNDMPYWQALDRFCEAAGLDYARRSRGSRGELVLVSSDRKERRVAYAGPVVLRVGGLMRYREFRPRKANDPSNHYVVCFARYEWEERLPVVDSEIWLTKLITPDGTDMIDAYAAKGPRRLTNHRATWNGPPGAFNIGVGHPPDDLQRLARIEGYFLFEFATGKRELKIDDVQDDKPAASDNHMGLEVLKSWWIDDSLVATLKISAKPGRTWPPLRIQDGPHRSPYGFFLEGPDDKRYPGVLTTVEPKLAHKLKALRKDGAGVADAHSEFQISCRFYTLPRDIEQWSLVWVYPETHDVQEYPFVMKDVPIR